VDSVTDTPDTSCTYYTCCTHATWQSAAPAGDTRPGSGSPLRRPLDRRISIVDIALLPDYCNRGIGTTVLRTLHPEASGAGSPLRIHVERFNPALRLYERLGFRQIEDKGVYLFLEWRARIDDSELVI
jgi:ribosomal protein S18 acetylase RimI-like enzyme